MRNKSVWIGGIIGGAYALILSMFSFIKLFSEIEIVLPEFINIFFLPIRLTAGPLGIIATLLINIFHLPEGIFEGDGLIIFLMNIMSIILWIIIGATIGAFFMKRKREQDPVKYKAPKQHWKKGIIFGILFSLINFLVFSLTFLLKNDLIIMSLYPFLSVPIYLAMALYPILGSLLDKNFNLIIWLVAPIFWILFSTLLFKLYDLWKTKKEKHYKFSFLFLIILFILLHFFASFVFMAMGSESGQETLSTPVFLGSNLIWFSIAILIAFIINKMVGRTQVNKYENQSTSLG
ncbi:MAG: hypothetical protein ABIJ14_04065 [Nanoarchaeota archaeon]